MQACITELEPIPTTLDELKSAVQALGEEMDFFIFMRHIMHIRSHGR